ncbi:tyrosine-type recombinase/integrase [Rhizobium aegyptiacum]|uniref:tyrosine-type recombinase/integrase n=1 Tax=Rhizobium aegyptiacum TaxID=1764550 RepID=UPI0007E58EE1|nr:tyrosine-type recombinase/integrase [Rhizobium aegyptiacum]
MGTIMARKRKDGKTGFTAQLVRKKDGKIVWREAKTFDTKREAQSWIHWREAEIDKPGAIEKLTKGDSTLSDAIDKYLAAKRTIGRTKEQCLRTIKTFPIASKDSRTIRSVDIVAFADELLSGGRKPQTVGNYVSHLAAIFRDAKAAWDIDLDYAEMQAAQRTLTRLEKTSKSEERTRRPTLGELDKLMQHFADRQIRAPHSAPMCKLIGFGIFSTRRQEEITRILWADLDEQHSRILVRDLKHPGQKKGNNVWCELVPEAMAIIKSMPRTGPEIFPYTGDAISAAFTRACQFLEINTEEMPEVDRLVFHSLRHEGISRLFEMGRTIPLAASVSGHRTWNSLKRYTDIKETGDKYAGWRWLEQITK